MSDPMFVLDSNVFIEAHRRYYGLDLCPGFWDWLRNSSNTGSVVSIDRVYQELTLGKDALLDWAKNNRDLFGDISQPTVVDAYRRVAAWVDENSQFPEDANIPCLLLRSDGTIRPRNPTTRNTLKSWWPD